MKDFSSEAYYLIFSTLANRTRLAIIDVLKKGGKTVREISTALEQEENVISHNLEPLTKYAMVLSTGLGKAKICCLNKELVEPLSELLEFHVNKYCPDFTKCIPPEKLREYMKGEAERKTYIEHE
jgi:DNA-binding transcriptional ArsR family regulator